MTEIAQTKIRYGYLRIHMPMAREGWHINYKRLYHLYQQVSLNLGMKRLRLRVSAAHRAGRTPSKKVNQMWSIDFVSDARFNGQRFRIVTLIDMFFRECLTIHMDIGIHAERMVEVVTAAFKHWARPVQIQVHNGSKFVSKALDLWAYEQGVT